MPGIPGNLKVFQPFKHDINGTNKEKDLMAEKISPRQEICLSSCRKHECEPKKPQMVEFKGLLLSVGTGTSHDYLVNICPLLHKL